MVLFSPSPFISLEYKPVNNLISFLLCQLCAAIYAGDVGDDWSIDSPGDLDGVYSFVGEAGGGEECGGVGEA